MSLAPSKPSCFGVGFARCRRAFASSSSVQLPRGPGPPPHLPPRRAPPTGPAARSSTRFRRCPRRRKSRKKPIDRRASSARLLPPRRPPPPPSRRRLPPTRPAAARPSLLARPASRVAARPLRPDDGSRPLRPFPVVRPLGPRGRLGSRLGRRRRTRRGIEIVLGRRAVVAVVVVRLVLRRGVPAAPAPRRSARPPLRVRLRLPFAPVVLGTLAAPAAAAAADGPSPRPFPPPSPRPAPRPVRSDAAVAFCDQNLNMVFTNKIIRVKNERVDCRAICRMRSTCKNLQPTVFTQQI